MSTPTTKPVTITITGAGGQIGYALLFRIASGAMLGPDTQVPGNLFVPIDLLKPIMSDLVAKGRTSAPFPAPRRRLCDEAARGICDR